MVLSEAQKNYLHETYYDISKTGSLRGPVALYEQIQSDGVNDISLNSVKEWLR